MSLIKDTKTGGGHLVSHIKVGETYHQRKEGVTTTQWYLFNDFSISDVEKVVPSWCIPFLSVTIFLWLFLYRMAIDITTEIKKLLTDLNFCILWTKVWLLAESYICLDTCNYFNLIASAESCKNISFKINLKINWEQCSVLWHKLFTCIHYLSHVMRKPVLCHMPTTKMQISLRIHGSSLISAFVVHCLDCVGPVVAILEIPWLASFCSWADWFESVLVGNLRQHVLIWHGSFSPGRGSEVQFRLESTLYHIFHQEKH